HGAALQHRDLLANLVESFIFARRQTAVAELVCLHQGTVNEKVRIAPDRRREVRVGGKCEAKMAEPLRTVTRLHLSSQKLLHDLLAAVGIADPLDNPVERARLDYLPKGKLDPERRKIVLHSDEFFTAGWLVDAVHHWGLLRFDRAGCSDVGSDHEIFDQSMSV